MNFFLKGTKGHGKGMGKANGKGKPIAPAAPIAVAGSGESTPDAGLAALQEMNNVKKPAAADSGAKHAAATRVRWVSIYSVHSPT